MYKRLLNTHPLTTNILTTAFLAGSGDVLAQIGFSKGDYDYKRTLRLATYSGLVFAPMGSKWYVYLHNLKVFPNELANAASRVALDQALFAPFVGIPLFYSCMPILEGSDKPIESAKANLEKHWWTTLLNNWTVWPAFQCVNFAYTPVQYKLLSVNVFSLFWNTYLSWELNENV